MAELTDAEWFALPPWVRDTIIYAAAKLICEHAVHQTGGRHMAENLAAAHNPHREDES